MQDEILDEMFDYNFTTGGEKNISFKEKSCGGLAGLEDSSSEENDNKDGLEALKDNSSSDDTGQNQDIAIGLEQMHQDEADQYNQ